MKYAVICLSILCLILAFITYHQSIKIKNQEEWMVWAWDMGIKDVAAKLEEMVRLNSARSSSNKSITAIPIPQPVPVTPNSVSLAAQTDKRVKHVSERKLMDQYISMRLQNKIRLEQLISQKLSEIEKNPRAYRDTSSPTSSSDTLDSIDSTLGSMYHQMLMNSK